MPEELGSRELLPTPHVLGPLKIMHAAQMHMQFLGGCQHPAIREMLPDPGVPAGNPWVCRYQESLTPNVQDLQTCPVGSLLAAVQLGSEIRD